MRIQLWALNFINHHHQDYNTNDDLSKAISAESKVNACEGAPKALAEKMEKFKMKEKDIVVRGFMNDFMKQESERRNKRNRRNSRIYR